MTNWWCSILIQNNDALCLSLMLWFFILTAAILPLRLFLLYTLLSVEIPLNSLTDDIDNPDEIAASCFFLIVPLRAFCFFSDLCLSPWMLPWFSPFTLLRPADLISNLTAYTSLAPATTRCNQNTLVRHLIRGSLPCFDGSLNSWTCALSVRRSSRSSGKNKKMKR